MTFDEIPRLELKERQTKVLTFLLQTIHNFIRLMAPQATRDEQIQVHLHRLSWKHQNIADELKLT